MAAARARSGAGITSLGAWGLWYPWYGSGLNWNYGYTSYNPFLYSYNRWTWGRYGMWYNPYDAFGRGYYDPSYAFADPWLYADAYGYGGVSGGGGGYSSSVDSDDYAP